MGKRLSQMKVWMMNNAYLVTMGCLAAIVVSCAIYTQGLNREERTGVQAAAGAPEISGSAAPSAVPQTTPLPTIAPLVVHTTVLTQQGGEWPLQGEVLRVSDEQETIYWECLDLWRPHTGLDIAGRAGEPVKACMDGSVVSAVWDEMWGWRIRIAHEADREMIYAGLESCLAAEGERVRRGQTIGTLLEHIPCEAELGTHVHLEMIRGGKYQDPEAVLAER